MQDMQRLPSNPVYTEFKRTLQHATSKSSCPSKFLNAWAFVSLL